MRHLSSSLIVLFASSFAVACSGTHETSKQDSEANSVSEALERDNGGLDQQNEQPSFGDPTIDEETPMADEAGDEDDTMARAAVDAPRGTMYRLALIWGHMPPARDASDADPDPVAADFSGGITVDRGAIGLSRTIRFDQHDRVEPRAALNEVRFTSHTLPRVDGLLVTVRIPDGAPTVLHFNTVKLTTDIDLAKLQPDVGGVVRSDDGYNGLSYLGFQDRPGCASGFVVGKWHKLRANLGKMHGRVIGDHGRLLGHVRGVWGHARRADKNVFFGKYIDDAGEFQGLFAGGYGDGQFRGLWGTREPRDVGALAGFYSDGYERHDARGVFLGRWQAKCDL